MKIQKNDFLEIEFTGKTKEGEIFDSNIKEDLAKTNLKVEAKPFVFCVGQGMFLKGIEDFLIDKEIKEYEIELKPEDAFGKRDSKLIQLIPTKIFHQQRLNPVQGAVFNFDGRLAKIISVSGGRVMTDFNHLLAGKTVIYKIKILRKIDDIKEKAKALIQFLFRKDFEFEIKDKKIILDVDEKLAQFVQLFKEKFKEILGLDLEVKKSENKTNSEKAENKSQ